MAVEVHDGLSGSGAAVSCRCCSRRAGCQARLRGPDSGRSPTRRILPDSISFRASRIVSGSIDCSSIVRSKKIRHFPLAHNQQMSRTHREPIVHNVKVFVFEESALRWIFALNTLIVGAVLPCTDFRLLCTGKFVICLPLPQRNYRTS